MKKILIDSFAEQKRIALIENGELVELIFENGKENSIVGNIYCGRIESVMAGMQACFVDIGLEKNAYLYYGSERAEKGLCLQGSQREKSGSRPERHRLHRPAG